MYAPIPNIDWLFLKSVYPDTLDVANHQWTTPDSTGKLTTEKIFKRWNTGVYRRVNHKRRAIVSLVFSHTNTSNEQVILGSVMVNGFGDLFRLWLNADVSESMAAGKVFLQHRDPSEAGTKIDFDVGSSTLSSGKDVNMVVLFDGTGTAAEVTLFVNGSVIQPKNKYRDSLSSSYYEGDDTYPYYVNCSNDRGTLSLDCDANIKLVGLGYCNSASIDFLRNLSSNLQLNLFNRIDPLFYADMLAVVPTLSLPTISSVTSTSAKVGATLTF